MVAPDGGRLDEGGSTTEFSLELPSGAQCPGDSAFEGWRVNSYMVPEVVDVARLTYDGLGPAPAGLADYERFRQPLYDVGTSPYASALTAAVQEQGDPGLIVDIPTFTLGVYSSGDVPAGRYHVGIACTLLNEVGRVLGRRDRHHGGPRRRAGRAAVAGRRHRGRRIGARPPPRVSRRWRLVLPGCPSWP